MHRAPTCIVPVLALAAGVGVFVILLRRLPHPQEVIELWPREERM
jgi:hypothetical protein